MKSFILILLILEIIFSISLSHSNSYAEERCQPYASSENYIHCYDLKTIQYSGKRFVKVLIKATAVTAKGKEIKIHAIKKRRLSTAGYENYLYTYELVEIDCKERKIRTWLFSDYNSKGKTLNTVIQPKEVMEQWFPIPELSTAGLLYQAVCP